VEEARGLSVEELRGAVEDGIIDAVSICTPDLQGKLMGKSIPADVFLRHLPAGIEVSCAIFVYDNEQNVGEGFPEIGEQNGWADMAAVPDLSSLRRAAHLDRSAIVLADLWWSAERPVEISPRAVLRTQTERAARSGLEPWAALEYEFYVYGETFESVRRKGYRGLEPLHATHQDYGLYRAHRDDAVLGALWRAFVAGGIPVECIKAEMGRGQYEITFAPAGGLEAADRAALAKLFTREISAQHGLAATFMARVDHRDMGSSGHVHLSVAGRDGNNLFDPDERGLSELGRRFTGGVMRRAPEFMLLACPYVNSYKRLDPENFVTAALDFRPEVRTTPFRLCGKGGSCNIEYRVPGADGNPYLILAAMIAAGLEGVETGAEPFELDSDEARRVGNLPETLSAAIDRWEPSEWARSTFGDLVVDTIAVCGRHELEAVEREVSDVELRRGFEWA
jgi:glutamine synthetase